MAMSVPCELCKKKIPLYKCPVCKATAHIDQKNGVLVLHLPAPVIPKNVKPRTPPVSFHFPSHIDCELGKPVDKIDLQKLVKVET